jgi:cell division protein ZapA (FtsZ GTPase activity inhibitor)
MSVVAIPILNKNYAMGCEYGQEMRLIEIGKAVDSRAREIQDKIGALPENALLATLAIVLMDEIMAGQKNNNATTTDESELLEILQKIREIKKSLG